MSASNSYGQPGSSFSIVGNPTLGRRDTYNKLIGKKKFTSDIQPTDIGIASATGFLWVGFVTCPYPNARIKSIDVSEAEAAGAITLTGYDYDFLPEYDYYSTSGLRSRGCLPTTQARYCGMPVVAVGGPTPYLTNDYIQMVKVEYEPLPYVFDAEAALKSGSPQIWPNGNAPAGTTITTVEELTYASSAQDAYGDAAAAIAEADQVVTLRLDTDVYQHAELEPRVSIIQYTEGTGTNASQSSTSGVTTSGTGALINAWDATEYVVTDQNDLASWFAVPTTNVQVRLSLGGSENGSTGGSFGNKIPPWEGIMIGAAMSKKSGLAAKLEYTKTNNFQAGIARWCERSYLTVAAKNGLITAVQGEMYTNVGALGGSNSDLGEFYAIYNVPNLNVVSYSANTNVYGTAGAMRNVGETQNTWFMETAIDMLAEKYNMDPVQFRLNNMKTAYYVDNTTTPPTVYNDTAFDPTTGYPFSGFGQPAHLLQTKATFNWSSRWQGWATPSAVVTNSGETQGTGKKLRGVGVALTSGAKGSLRAPDTGQILVMPSGAVTVYSGIMDHGGGGPTTIPMIAAEAIGMTLAQYGTSVTTPGSGLTAVLSDTTQTTDSGITAGSAGTRNMGLGMISAAQNLGTQWFPLVAAKLAAGTKAANLAFGGGTSGQPSGIIFDTTNPSNQMTWKAAAALLPPAGLKGLGNYVPPTHTAYRVGGTRFVEVEVDTETADVRVIDFVGGLGIGRVIFPLGAEAQQQGALLFGVGETLFTDYINDSSTGLKYSGANLSANYLDNKVPSIYQTPNRNMAVWEEYVDPYGPFGAVGIGENTLMGIMPAILNALSNAMGGYRFTKCPIRKEDVVTALQWMKANGKL